MYTLLGEENKKGCIPSGNLGSREVSRNSRGGMTTWAISGPRLFPDFNQGKEG
jgi:hypothetical protein